MSKIRVECNKCGESLKVPEKYLGKKVKCPSCKRRFEAKEQAAPVRQERSPKPSVPLSYDKWVGRVIQQPTGAGLAGSLLAVTSVGVLVFTFVVFWSTFYNMIPAGRYPRILVAAPFLFVTAGVFFGLSPFFYLLYRMRFKGKS